MPANSNPQTNIDLENMPGNLLSRLEDAETQIREIKNAQYIPPPEGVQVVDLMIFPDEGVTVTDPTSVDYTGGFACGEGLTFGGIIYTFGYVKLGVIQWGGRKTDAAYVAGAGAVVLDVLGETLALGDMIFVAGYGLIGSAEVGVTPTPVLSLENYNQASANTLTNVGFETGDFTGWATSGTAPSVISTDHYAGSYCASLQNGSTIAQTIGTFAGKHPVCYFWHKGPAVVATIEILDAGGLTVLTRSATFSASAYWVRCSIALYNDSAITTQAKITFDSFADGVLVDSVNLLKLDDYAGLFIGDTYGTNKDVIRARARKLMIGNGSASDRTEMLDVRGTGYVQGALTVGGVVINANLSAGWTPSSGWSYASAKTITVPSGAASIYQKGYKLTWIANGVTLFAYVVGVADTLLTVLGNTVTNFTFSGMAYSNTENPFGFPTSFAWTPGYTGFSANPTPTGAVYNIDKGFIEVWYTDGNGASNQTYFTITGLPIAPTVGFSVPARITDNSVVKTTAGAVAVNAAATTATIRSDMQAGAWQPTNNKGVSSFYAKYAY